MEILNVLLRKHLNSFDILKLNLNNVMDLKKKLREKRNLKYYLQLFATRKAEHLYNEKPYKI